jgi:quercetin dioxygenase-like cupin family protein
MSIPHAKSGELIDIRPLGKRLSQTDSSTLVRAEHLEVFRLNLSAGKSIQEHKATGTITIQCLEGTIEIDAHGRTQELRAGSMVYLADSEPHAVRALEDASLLITVLLHRL